MNISEVAKEIVAKGYKKNMKCGELATLITQALKTLESEKEKEIEARKKIAESKYHPIALLESENKALRETVQKKDRTIEQAWLLLKEKDNG